MLLIPNVKLDRIIEITPSMLQSLGIRGLILDVDNTLSTHHGQQLTDGLPEWLAEMRNYGIRLTILSNSTPKRLKPFAEKIGLDFISRGLKPLPFGYFRACRLLGTRRTETAIVGDQIFTDVLGGNMAGLTTVLLTPILPEKSIRFRIKRRLERWVIRHYHIKITEEL